MLKDGIDRRALLKGCGCAMAGMAAGRSTDLFAAGKADVIDVHYHVTTERMRQVVARGGGSLAALDALGRWTVQGALAKMDAAEVALSIISMPVVSTSIPGGPADHAAFARGANEEAAAIVARTPKRFRFFGFVPLPHIDESLKEIAHALDTLKADGVYLCTSYGNKWLGDKAFEPVLAELNRRKAIVYTHPMGAACCTTNLVPNVLPTIIEYGTDTARSIASLIFSGAQQRYPDIRFIFSHAGGTAPFLFERFQGQEKAAKTVMPDGARAALGRFFYDTAQAANPYALGTLLRLVPDTQIMFGSDVPWRDQASQLASLEAMKLGDPLTSAIRYGNARRLIPGLPA